MAGPKKIAIVLDPTSARRLAPGMFSAFKPGRLYWLLDAVRPKAEIYRTLKQWQPDGIIMRVMPGAHQLLMRLHKPIVICGGNRAQPGVASVGGDNLKIGEEAAAHLLSLGLTSFGYFGVNAPFSLRRERGFVSRAHAAGIQPSVYVDQRVGWEHYMEMSEENDAELEHWVKSLPKPLGVFAGHDPLGWKLTQVCRQAGISVPEQVAVVGANDDELVCHLSSPPLSSVAVPWKRIGAEAAIQLERMLDASENGGPVPGAYIKVPPRGVTTRQSTDTLAVEDSQLRIALRFIKEHAHEPITVKDVASHVSISRRKLELDFVRLLSRTPKEEITRVRVARAKVLLGETNLPIPIVAEQCGYNYAERFTMAFRSSVGVTPSAFRKSMRPMG